MVVHITKQKAGCCLVHDQPDVAAHTHRPEVLIFGLVKFMQAHARIDRIHLQIESSRLDELLLIAGEFG